MNDLSGIVKASDPILISLCESVGNEINLEIKTDSSMAQFLLDLQEKDFNVSIFDCSDSGDEYLLWIKVLRKMRPKLPLVIVGDDLDLTNGSKMYQEGVFYLCERPVHKQILEKVLIAAIKAYQT